MRIAVESFRGMAPRITPRALPENGAQRAVNARLQSGDLEAWRQFIEIERLAIAPMTIYLLNDQWMAWETDVDVARSPIPGDDTFRVYLTGPDEYAQPRWTNYSLAFQSPGGTAPVVTRPIGVPESDSAPTLEVGVDSTPTTTSIDTLDDNASLASSWSVNPPLTGSRYATVTQGAGVYEVRYDENRDPGQEAYGNRNFGVAGVNVLTVNVNFLFTGDTGHLQACAIVGASGAGAGVGATYNDGTLSIRKTSAWGAQFFNATLSSVAVSPALSAATTYTMRVNVVTNPDETKTVTAKILDAAGTVELATLTATNNFEDGDYCGFANGVSDDAGTQYQTNYSNYHAQASGSTNATVTNVATSYVFTLVNDLGEESAPSPPSATILRPDGVSVTVTTSVSLPTGISADYEIEAKRIYRAVTGATGSIFRFVTEIPLSQEDYVDTLTDAQLGEALESEGWDLPPDDLRGILALPNGIMVGFRRNQLCFSAQNRPHAWPPAYRLNTDTDIVAIGAIDTAVIIGTQSFPYVAQGQSPESYAAAKLEVPQACVAKRSLAYVSGLGVVFASPDGLMAIAGVAAPVNITRAIFTRKQWQALNPESIICAAHDDVVHFFYSLGASSAGAGYALDAKPDGFGLIELAYHATAAHADPLTDALYLVLDDDNEPTDASLPTPPTFELATLPVDPDFASVRLLANIADDTADDASTYLTGHTNSGSVAIAAQHIVVGPLNSASQDGNFRWTGANLDRGSGAFTHECFFNVTSNVNSGSLAEILRWDVLSSGVNISVNLGQNGALVVFWLPTGVGSPQTSGNLSIPTIGVQHHLAIVVPAGTNVNPRIYFDGALLYTAAVFIAGTGTSSGRVQAGTSINTFAGMNTAYKVRGIRSTSIERYSGSTYTVPDFPLPETDAVEVAPAIYQFDGDETSLMTYLWRGRLNLPPAPYAPGLARVEADDFDNLIVRGYQDGVEKFEKVITSAEEFTLPTGRTAKVSYEQELIGTSRVRTFQTAEDIGEIR